MSRPVSAPFIICESEIPSAEEGDDKKPHSVAESAYLNNALDVFAAFQKRDNRIGDHYSCLAPYYASVQRRYISRLSAYVPVEQRPAVAQLFVQSYVTAADPDIAPISEQQDIYASLKRSICDAVAYHEDITVPQSYLGEEDVHNRTRINAKVMVDHHINWMIKLAHDDGAAYGAQSRTGQEQSSKERSSKQPSP